MVVLRILTLIILFSLLTIPSFAQFQDDFSDGNFDQNPEWLGNTGSFKVNSSGQLQLDTTPSTGVKYLATYNQAVENTTWEFWVKMAFDPSANNNVKIYLASDNPDLTTPLNGYFIRMGENLLLDGIDLFRQNGTTETLLISGIDGHAAIKPTLRIKVIHRPNGDWELYSDTTGGMNYKPEGTANDASISTSYWFGVVCKYTTSNAKAFYFDDFYVGPERKDTIGPKLVHSVFDESSYSLTITFNEDLDTSKPIGFFQNDILIFSIVILDLRQVKVVIKSGIQRLMKYNFFCSAYDNSGNYGLSFGSFRYYYIYPDEIVINEFMADPSPPLGLPETEFIELFNTLEVTYPLTGFTVSDGSSIATINADSIPARGFVILCKAADTAVFNLYGKSIAVNLPSLNNSGDSIILRAKNGVTLDKLFYNLDWYNDNVKKDGGWSLERVSPYPHCQIIKNNWKASNNTAGGSPGTINSVFDSIDITAPLITFLGVISDSTLSIQSNELIFGYDSIKVKSSNKPLKSFNIVKNSYLQTPLPTINITFSEVFESNDIYSLKIRNFKDCKYNKKNIDTFLVIPGRLDSADIIINEILFNPRTYGYDFVEIFNRSKKILDLSKINLVSLNDSGQIKQAYPLSKNSLFLPSGEYAAFTANRDDIMNKYTVKYPDMLFKMSSFPSYNDDKGHVVLTDNNNRWIDNFKYDEKMHFPLLSDREGVSLERVNPEFPSSNASNWQSASSNSGYATPTYKNSQYSESDSSGKEFSLFPKVFSPDNDGFDDVLFINYHFADNNNFGSIAIYDISGRLVRKLVNNDLFGTEGFYIWDGIDEDGKLAPRGVYILFIEVVNTNGTVKKYKLVATLAGK